MNTTILKAIETLEKLAAGIDPVYRIENGEECETIAARLRAVASLFAPAKSGRESEYVTLATARLNQSMTFSGVFGALDSVKDAQALVDAQNGDSTTKLAALRQVWPHISAAKRADLSPLCETLADIESAGEKIVEMVYYAASQYKIDWVVNKLDNQLADQLAKEKLVVIQRKEDKSDDSGKSDDPEMTLANKKIAELVQKFQAKMNRQIVVKTLDNKPADSEKIPKVDQAAFDALTTTTGTK